jgi:hypothetical protein
MPVADCGECLEWEPETQIFSPNKKVLHRMASKATKMTQQ